MSTELLISALALAVAVVAAAAAVAGLNDEGRTRLASWSKSAAGGTFRVCKILFVLGALLNGIAGVVVFGLDPSPPTRKDVLSLVLFLLNIAIGIEGVWKFANSKESSRASKKQPISRQVNS